MKHGYLSVLLLFALPAIRADWKEDVGFYRLQRTFTTGVPVAVAAGVTQTEASDKAGNYYLPDDPSNPSQPEFALKTLINKSSGTGVSGHAVGVGSYFYGNYTSLIPATPVIDSYNANSWIYTDFLQSASNALPANEPRRVQNHSWINFYETDLYTPAQINATVADINQRLDYAIDRDGFISVAGANNGSSTVLPDLLVQGYNTLAVGLANGNHSAGLTTRDGAGRMKPDIVGFEGVTSNSTPQVASAAGLLSEKLRNAYSSVLATSDYPRLTKALLLAGAAKEPLAAWSRADTTKPYDAVYGAGALNVLLSYRILDAGRQMASASHTVAEAGWDTNTASTSTSQRYFFDIPEGTISSRFSTVLTWHRGVATWVFADNLYWIPSLANLDLRLYTATGTTLGTMVDASISTVDNVEHIYQATLPPGRYALVVSSSTANSTPYALAWRTSPTVTVAATTPVARELDASPAVFTITRTGSTTSPLLVPLNWSGTAVSGTHYVTPPADVLIPAGAPSATVSITPVSDNLAQGDRTVSLFVATDYSLSAGATPSAAITIQDKPYDSWRFSHFTPGELDDSNISGPSADPDTDGQSNLMEYALSAEPKIADSLNHAPVASITDDHITLTYTRPTLVADVTYSTEWSVDLQTWQTGAAVIETLSTTDNGDGTTTVTDRALAALTSAPRQFLRLRVTRP